MTLQYILELAGTCFLSISGSLAANRKSKPDLFGVTIIGFATSLGGGSLRDVLLGSYPLVWVKDVYFIYAVLAGVLLANIFYSPLIKLRRTFFLFDTLGIAMFTILGTRKALLFDVHPFIAAIMGMLSAVMGGVLRDVLTNEIPILFRKEIYATACLAGAIVYLVLIYIGVNITASMLIAITFILIIRIWAIKYNIALPKFKGVADDSSATES
ncbi:MAG TPA: trimeric intracellular cation channel family protein [Bacteroidia bacterium]|jgi:uncharacterized membrane protein YeiH|nr:trimeric intracellular cation channel family protein [Bacteroidia bacterium]